MHCIDSIQTVGSDTVIIGWWFEPGKQIAECQFVDGKDRISLQGYGLASPDVATIHGDGANHCRFEFRVPKVEIYGHLALKLKTDGTRLIPISSREDIRDQVEVLVHYFSHGQYFGRFKLPEDALVKRVDISMGGLNDGEAYPVAAKDCSFDQKTTILSLNPKIRRGWEIDRINVFIHLKNGTLLTLVDISNHAREGMAPYQIVQRFFDWIDESQEPLSILELGSRARSGNTNRGQFSDRHHYTGVDLLEGENVNIVADVHSLSDYFKPDSIDGIFGISVFEHLAMPWKAAIELNRIMRMGARAMFLTHQTWPLHDKPFDFWRYSSESWHALFNQSTGFKLVEAAMGDEAHLTSTLQGSATLFPDDSVCYLASGVIVEKIGNTSLSWDVPVDEIYRGSYPH
ncbi:MAG: hypothetical protein O3C43_02210 [Verrucomicrobia bacterium]|nr:hypothetical protein [Verrucomicrobiota bacterium]MDA1065297.1 hypothetical protein [Verrucomicrobiota bacterium]